MLLDGVSVGYAVSDVGHAVEVECTNEEALHEASDLGVIVRVVSGSDCCNASSSKSQFHGNLESKNFNYYKSLAVYLNQSSESL